MHQTTGIEPGLSDYLSSVVTERKIMEAKELREMSGDTSYPNYKLVGASSPKEY